MRTTAQFLSFLREQGVIFKLDGEKLGCSAPPGVLTASLRSELTQRKPEIVALLTSGQVNSGQAQAPDSGSSFPSASTHAVDRTQPLPVSRPQARLWFIHQLEPESPVYHVACALRLSGALRADVLEDAIVDLIARHECLRTSFTSHSGQPAAIVHATVPWALHQVDLSGRPAAAREDEATQVLHAEAARPFDLGTAPLCRAVLVRVEPTLHFFGLTLHHVVTDGWSLGIILGELMASYEAGLAGRRVAHEPFAMQFVDYVAWQERWLEGPEVAAQMAWWHTQLAGPLPTLELPADRPRPRRPSSRGDRRRHELPVALSDGARALARELRTTLFPVLLAAFKILLQRYTGQDDLIVGTASAGRRRPEAEPLVGMFVDTLVLRTPLDDHPTVRDCVRRVFQTTLQAAAHADVPFDRLVSLASSARDLAHDPLVQVMFTMHNFPVPRLAGDAFDVKPVPLHLGTARLDLSVDVGERHDTQAIETVFEYRTDLFDEATIARMQDHFECLLAAMVAQPDAHINALPMLTASDEAWLATHARQAPREYPRETCVHELVRPMLLQDPERVAVRLGSQVLTRGELTHRADELTRRLRVAGVRRGDLVALMATRSLDTPAALLGILQCGAAYLPIDASCPPDRLAYMLEDAGVSAVVTHTDLRARLGAVTVPLLCLDAGEDSDAATDVPLTGDPRSPDAPSADDLAYVIYTSGSTGRPKGVEITHRSVVNFLCSMHGRPGLSADDRLLAVTTLSFDIAGLEMFLPMLAGAEVVIATRAEAADGAALARIIDDSDITVMQATPATWRLLLDVGWRGRRGFKALCGGEGLPAQLARRLLDCGCELWNMYGPTETTIWSTVEHVRTADEPISIGTPIANTHIVILDGAGRPTAIGVPGELCIGGDGLARGYRNRPQLTAERFVTHASGRLYRTGDLARWRSDGRLELLGRLDRQVKVRGFRIELGEIESALVQVDGVRHALVVARQRGGDVQLVAYVVPAAAVQLEPSVLRAGLSRSLPDYMIPAAFVSLTALPLGPTGKVDHAALPDPGVVTPPRQPTFARATSFEAAVAEEWRDLLGAGGFGLHDNFYDVGGHSLLIVQLQHRLRARFDCDIALVELFERPTVSAIAAWFEAQSTTVANPVQMAR